MDREVTIDGKQVKLRATARTPRLYRGIIGRDMIADMNKLMKAYDRKKKGEDVAYIMARQASPDMEEKTADDWLDTFDMFSIYEVLPHILELWAINTKQTSQSKKK